MVQRFDTNVLETVLGYTVWAKTYGGDVLWVNVSYDAVNRDNDMVQAQSYCDDNSYCYYDAETAEIYDNGLVKISDGFEEFFVRREDADAVRLELAAN